jgi:hypothetical protein
MCHILKMLGESQVWWYRSIIPALGSLRQEDEEFGTSTSYIKSSRPACGTL